MPSAASTKASDKALACKKLTTILQKEYGKAIPKFKQPVLETMLFAVCLEDNDWDAAEAAFEKLLKSYYDLNEIRVSSVTEIERTLSGLKNADWKGLRIRSILRFVFESTYTFEFEKLAKLTVESAQKRLKKIEFLSPFVTNFTLQQVLGCHVVTLDDTMLNAAIHLGIVPPDHNINDAGEFLKAGIKKAETFAFTCLLKKFATDPKFANRIDQPYEEEDEFDVLKVEQRLAALKAPPKKKKKPVEKVVEKKAASKASKSAEQSKPVASKKATESTKSAAVKSTASKKATPGKSTAKKPAAARNSDSAKAPARKTAAKPKSATKKPAPAPKKKTSKK